MPSLCQTLGRWKMGETGLEQEAAVSGLLAPLSPELREYSGNISHPVAACECNFFFFLVVPMTTEILGARHRTGTTAVTSPGSQHAEPPGTSGSDLLNGSNPRLLFPTIRWMAGLLKASVTFLS